MHCLLVRKFEFCTSLQMFKCRVKREDVTKMKIKTISGDDISSGNCSEIIMMN